MAAYKTSTRTVYQTERIRIDRISDRYSAQYALYLDNSYYSTYPTMNEAEHEAAVQMDQEARDLAATLADEAAERDARCPTCGSDGTPCVDCNPMGDIAIIDADDAVTVVWRSNARMPTVTTFPTTPGGLWRLAQYVGELEQAGWTLEAA